MCVPEGGKMTLIRKGDKFYPTTLADKLILRANGFLWDKSYLTEAEYETVQSKMNTEVRDGNPD